MHPTEARQQLQDQQYQQEFDLLIIGGGASGLGAAVEASQRGLKVALVEAGDYAQGASTASTKLIHGGVRYLEKAFKELDWGQYQLVREALHERSRMLQNAPHLGWPARLVIPAYSLWERVYYGAGCKVYDWTAGRGNDLPGTGLLNKAGALKAFPELNPQNLSGGVLYSDGQFDDAAYALALLRTARKAGVLCLNYAEVQGFERDRTGKIQRTHIRSSLNGRRWEIRAKVILNCTGAQADRIRQLARPGTETRLRPSKGIHLMLDADYLTGSTGLLIPKTADGRVIFVLPWRHGTLIGTTDTETEDAQAVPQSTAEDVQYLIAQTQPYLSKPLRLEDVRSVFAGNRPLVAATGRKGRRTEALIRNHEVEVFQAEGLISLLGGKWTTYRQMAEEALDAVEIQLGRTPATSSTPTLKLAGAPNGPLPQAEGIAAQYRLPLAVARHLLHYGGDWQTLAQRMETQGSEQLHPAYPYTVAEIGWWVEETQAATVEDILRRRLPLELANLKASHAAAPVVARELGRIYNWQPMDVDWNAASYQMHAERVAEMAGLPIFN